jgi:DNA-binding FadR family transcriptional regulator
MKSEGIVRSPAYAQVTAQIREAVLRGELPPGSVLPSERDLGVRFNVSRTTIREALRALQAQGLVVAKGPNAPLRITEAATLSSGAVGEALSHLMQLGRIPLDDLVELRCTLEAAAVEAAAHRTPPPDLTAAHEQIGIMRAAGTDVVGFEKADVELHLQLTRASGNEAIYLVMLAVREAMASYLLETLRAAEDAATTIARLTREHEAIVEAVERRDAELAIALMGAHVRGLYTGWSA